MVLRVPGHPVQADEVRGVMVRVGDEESGTMARGGDDRHIWGNLGT